MGKRVNFLFGISLTLVIILFSITPAYAVSQEVDFTIESPSFFLDSPFAVTTDSQNRIFVAAPFVYNIYKYDSSGNLLDTFNFSTTIQPTAISVDTNNRIIVADALAGKVYVLDSTGNLLFEINDIFGVPSDVTTDSKDRIIVTDQTNRATYILDTTGALVHTIIPPHTNDIPTGVTTDSQDRIIISDVGNKKIHIYNSEGEHQFTIHEAISGSDFIEPHRVTTDSQDRIIVADSNNSATYGVFIYDSDGNFLHSIVDSTLDIDKISGITSDSNDRIIVADSNDRLVRVFSMDYSVAATSDSCSSDCTPPSLKSLELNDNTNWLTAKNQTFNIGDKQVLKFVYFEDEGIDDLKDVEIGFGLPTKKSPMYTSEIRLQINTFNGNLTSLEIDDDNKIFLENYTTVKVDQVQCGLLNCLEYTLEFVWAEIPFDDYFLITASDDHRNTSYNSSQEPLTVIGETLNEQPIYDIYNRHTSTKHDGYSFNITRTDKVTDMWIDEKGEEWRGLGNDRFELVN